METGSAVVPLSPFGPMLDLALHVHELANAGRPGDAIRFADEYESVATLLGDDKTVDFLIQGRMYAYQYLGRLPQALSAGQRLLERQRATGNVNGEAKVLTDLAELSVLSGYLTEGMRYLARAGLLLEAADRRNDRYAAALAGYAQAASVAGLFEVAGSTYEQVLRDHRTYLTARGSFVEHRYLELLIPWAFRLDQVGHHREARGRLRRASTITAEWLAKHSEPDPDDPTAISDVWEISAIRGLVLAKLGATDEAIAVVKPVLAALREHNLASGAWAAHLALGIALRARTGDGDAARRELLAAREWCGPGNWADDELIIGQELALLAAETSRDSAAKDLLACVQMQARLLWKERLQHLAMLHQAREREQLNIEQARTREALLHDPLTGLGNRRRFDQLVAAVDDGQLGRPLTLFVIDVDRFKLINDAFSHTVGDSVLREIAAVIGSHCRDAGDIPVRYAGDEFTLFCRSDLAGARQVAERIRQGVAEGRFEGVPTGVSVSIGGAELTPGMSGAELFRAADANLYEAKHRGRDRVAV